MASSPIRVLAVDDDPLSLEMIEAVVGAFVEVTAVQSGEAALLALDMGNYAAVLLDVGLPGIDGFEVARQLKEQPRTQHIPIIFLTGAIGEEEVRRGYALGAADYLLKPFDPDILRAKVHVFVDLAQLRREAGMLRHRALHDPLTGLPNRTLYLDRLELALARLAREPGYLAVLFLDVDGFKAVNDVLGHDAGDRCLVEIATRLQAVIRATDTAARFGGDEFLLLLEGIHEPDEVDELLRRIAVTLTEPYDLREEQVLLSVATGVATTDDPAARPEDLIRAADVAMLREKVVAKRNARQVAGTRPEAVRRGTASR
jgi:diguanylate cyclase (GGDEF)-like protein